MVIIDTCVYNSDNHILCPGSKRPCLLGFNVSTCCSNNSLDCLAGVEQTIQLAKTGIIRNSISLQNIVWLGVNDVRVGTQLINESFSILGARVKTSDIESTYLQYLLIAIGISLYSELVEERLGGARLYLYQDFSRQELIILCSCSSKERASR